MKRQILRTLATSLCASAVSIAIAISPVSAQSHPKYMENGGLTLTRFAIDQHSGSSWVTATTFKPQGEYRITFRLTNYYPPPNLYGDQCHVIRIQNLAFSVKVSGGIFYPSSSFSGSGTGTGSTHSQSDPQPLLNGQSRTYFLYYKWIAPNTPVSTHNHTVSIQGEDVCYALPAYAPIRQTP